MSLQLRWLLAVAALVGPLTTVSVDAFRLGRVSVSKRQTPAPVTANVNPNSDLLGRLDSMSEQQITYLETAIKLSHNDSLPMDDDDMMLADMPPSTDEAHVTAQPDEFSPEAERESIESVLTEDRYVNSTKSNKKLRLKTIKDQIMDYMGWSTRNPSPSPIMKSNSNASSVPTEQKDALRTLYEKLNIVPSYPFDTFTEKTQSFYPNCGLPKNINEDLWYTKYSMNLMLNISVPKPSVGNTVNITTATLRLYKQLMPCTSPMSNDTTEDVQDCSSVSSEEIPKRSNTNSATSAEIPTTNEDKQIRVSVYAYTRALKKKKVRRKLLDCRMVPYYSVKWTEWNIRTAVKNWRQDPIRNFGISVEVEDEDGNLLPVNRFFKPMNCTPEMMQLSTPKPMPGFLIEYGYSFSGAANATANVLSVDALYSNSYRYPMVDVTTIEIPNSEASKDTFLAYTRRVLGQNADGRTSVQQGPDDRRPEHRIRHDNNNRHKANGTAAAAAAILGKPNMNLSDAEREFRDRIIVLQKHVPMPPAQTSGGDDDGELE